MSFTARWALIFLALILISALSNLGSVTTIWFVLSLSGPAIIAAILAFFSIIIWPNSEKTQA